jgi:hypothetical protein
MHHAVHHFHTVKDVFLLGQANNKAQAKANTLKMELTNKRLVE